MKTRLKLKLIQLFKKILQKFSNIIKNIFQSLFGIRFAQELH